MDLTARTHARIREHFGGRNLTNCTAVDATCGHGKDTEFLGKLGFGKVIAMDIQQIAVDATVQRIRDAGLTNIKVYKQDHQFLERDIVAPIECAMFNFGYLPNADKTKTTQAHTTLMAAQSALSILNQTGLISFLCYPGHPAGLSETNRLKTWLDNIDRYWICETHLARSPKPTAPILFVVKSR
jgi:hypothetical protein